ncbi:MAG: hypothetical protein VX498_13875 [Myxococcota bacterium]|nr:hypothetical protein [Myxococcota bacterium]
MTTLEGLCRASLLLLLPWLWSCALAPKAQMAAEAAGLAPVLAECRCQVIGLGTGTLEPGGEEQLWMADVRGVHRVGSGGRTESLWTAPRFTEVLRFEAADIDGDGVSEWVVLLDSGRMRSFVLRWDGESWQPSAPWAGYLRPLRDGRGELTLVGQRSGGSTAYRGLITRVLVGESGSLTAGEPVPSPPGVSIYDFFWLRGDPGRLFVLESNGSISERDPRSPTVGAGPGPRSGWGVLWRSEDRPVARPVEVEREVRDLLGDLRDERIRLAPPVAVVQLDDDPAEEVLVVTGVPAPQVVFENLRLYRGGDIRAYDPELRGLKELHRTPLLGRSLSAVVAVERGGEDLWVGAIWTRLPGGFTRPESRLLLFDPASGNVVGPSLAAGGDEP